MYVACIMYKKARVASVLLCESPQSVVPLNDSVCKGTATHCCRLLAKKTLPGALCYISIRQI